MRALALACAGLLGGCSGGVGTRDASTQGHDAGARDAGPDAPSRVDAHPALHDAGSIDATTVVRDSGHAAADGGRDATRAVDGARDAVPILDASRDASQARDAAPGDAMPDQVHADQATDDAGADAPAVTNLALSLALTPAFSTSITDYTVQCADGANDVVVTMTAAAGSTIELRKPSTTHPASEKTVSVSVDVNAAIVVGVTTGGVTTEYWVRCLPPNFPLLEARPYPDASAPTPGYYVIGSVAITPDMSGYAMILDGHGVPVWYQSLAIDEVPYDVENLTPGVVSFSPVSQGPSTSSGSREFDLVNIPTGTTRYVTSTAGDLDFHELRVLPDGDYLLFSDLILKDVDLSGLGFGTSVSLVDCLIQEITPAGVLVWQWQATDHFDVNQDSTFPFESGSGDGGLLVDAIHCNSIDVAANGDLLVSARNMDTVFLVSKATGKVVWKMGGPTYTKDDATYLTVTGDPLTQFYREHDARFQPDGTISMFDDQTQKPGPARAVIYAYDVDAGTATMAWQFQGTSVSQDMGSFRIDSDGSRVIGWGAGPPQGPAFTEVTEGGARLMDFDFTGSWNVTYRAVKVPTSAFDIGVLRSAVGGQ